MTVLFLLEFLFCLQLTISFFVIFYIISGHKELRERLSWPEVKSNSKWKPFLHPAPDFTLWAVLNLLLGSIFIVPRILLVIFSVVLYWICLKIILFHEVLDGAYLSSFKFSLVYWLGRFFSRVVLLGFGVHYIRFDRGAISAFGSQSILANHQGYLDILIMMTLFMPAFVSKEDVASVPVIGLMCRAACGLFIDRKTGAGKQSAKICARQLEMLKENLFPPLLVFPEGTTTNGKSLLQFRTGAFLAGTPVLPVVISYESHPSVIHTSWDSIPFSLSLISNLCCLFHSVTVKVLPLQCSEKTGDLQYSASFYAASVASIMADCLEVPLVSADLQDKFDYFALVKKKTGFIIDSMVQKTE